jgi:hypothetical protein
MALNNTVRRDYTTSDADMLTNARNKLASYREDSAIFEDFDNQIFNVPMEQDWLAALNIADQTLDDDSVLEQQTQLTAAIEAKMVECRAYFQKQVKYFIEKAFPNQPLVWNEFGYNDYDKVRVSAKDMVRFMRKLHIFMQKYQAQLLTANFPLPKIALAETLRIELDTILTTQEYFIASRPSLTQDRINKLNKVFGYMAQVCKVGKMLFDDDEVRYERYLL